MHRSRASFPPARLGTGVEDRRLSPSLATKSNSAMAASSILTPWSRAPRVSAARIISIRSAVIGGDPQDLTYKGERVSLEVGDDNEFREFSHRQSRHGEGRRRHPPRQPQPDHVLRAHRPRLPDRQTTRYSSTAPRSPATSPSRTTPRSARSAPCISSAALARTLTSRRTP